MPRPPRPAPNPGVDMTTGVIPTGPRLRQRDGHKLIDRRGVTVNASDLAYRFFDEGGVVGIWAGCHYVTVSGEEAIELGHELVQAGWDVIEARD